MLHEPSLPDCRPATPTAGSRCESGCPSPGIRVHGGLNYRISLIRCDYSSRQSHHFMLITCLARAVLATAVTAIAAAAAVEHTRDVQPIFQKRCYGCHGAS